MNWSSFRAVQKRSRGNCRADTCLCPYPSTAALRKVSLFPSRKLYLISQMLYQLLVLSVWFQCYYDVQRASRVSWRFSVLYFQCTFTGMVYFPLQWTGPLISCANGLVKLVGNTPGDTGYCMLSDMHVIIVQLLTTIESWRTISFPSNSKQLPVFSD